MLLAPQSQQVQLSLNDATMTSDVSFEPFANLMIDMSTILLCRYDVIVLVLSRLWLLGARCIV